MNTFIVTLYPTSDANSIKNMLAEVLPEGMIESVTDDKELKRLRKIEAAAKLWRKAIDEDYITDENCQCYSCALARTIDELEISKTGD